MSEEFDPQKYFRRETSFSLRDEIVEQSRKKHAKIGGANLKEVEGIVDDALKMTAKFEEIAKSRNRNIYLDTDVVWSISAPGQYTSSPDFPHALHLDRYQRPWSKEMYRHRLRTSAALIHEITARRLNKDTRDVTSDDIKNHGPWLLYNPSPDEKDHIEAVLSQPAVKIPPEKTFIYYDVIENDGSVTPMFNTSDQVRGLRFPNGLEPRRVLIVSHSPHLVRISYIMDKYRKEVENVAIFQAFPIKIPSGGEEEFVGMEIEAILRYYFDFGKAGNKPYSLVVE